jgi:hypothetical protein
MSPLVLIVVAAFLIAGWLSEPSIDAERAQAEWEACTGVPQPVDEETLVRTLGRFGFELEREDYCEGYGDEPAAMLTNITAAVFEEPESDVIFDSDGQVWCELYSSTQFSRAEVTRRRVDDEVVLRTLNVECRIYESNAWQIERLDDAMHQVLRAR